MKRFKECVNFVLLVIYLSATSNAVHVSFNPDDMRIQIYHSKVLEIKLSDYVNHSTTLYFTYYHDEDKSMHINQSHQYIRPLPDVNITTNQTLYSVQVTGEDVGHVYVNINSTSQEIQNDEASYVTVKVVHYKPLVIINAVIGWMYFVAWSISFYPQVYINWKRKSVIGLNFDFLAYNLTGFLAYGFFNIGMFWVPAVMNEYRKDNPKGVNPVQLNDVVFTLHAVFVTSLTIFQCFIYERGGQRISRVAMVLLSGGWLFAIISLFVAVGHKITWLQYLYYLSYIKLGVTLIKYVPQAYMNYRRQSTEGWSIGNILLDFTGGSLSLLQMFLISYNNNDWGSIFGDPTKFGLGFFSILFDILFMVQHYCLYRGNKPYEMINSEE